jgi:hypothetical protein
VKPAAGYPLLAYSSPEAVQTTGTAAEQLAVAVNAGDEITGPPSNLPLKPDDQFRLINQRLDQFKDEISKVSAPPSFRTADVVQLLAIVIGVLIAIGGAFNLSERISDVRTDQSAMEQRIRTDQSGMEQRIGDNVKATEGRIAPRLDRLNDQFNSIDERISKIEGASTAGNPPQRMRQRH